MQNKTYTCLFLLSCLSFSQMAHAQDCSKAQAELKMRALSQAWTENSNSEPQKQQHYAFMARDTSMVGYLLAEKNYNEACKRYDEIANKYGVDIKEFEKKLAPANDKQAIKNNGCDVTTASLKTTAVFDKFREKRKKEGLKDEQINLAYRPLAREMEAVYPLIQTNPNEACKKIDQIEKSYHLK
jgi:hypothetical protein